MRSTPEGEARTEIELYVNSPKSRDPKAPPVLLNRIPGLMRLTSQAVPVFQPPAQLREDNPFRLDRC